MPTPEPPTSLKNLLTELLKGIRPEFDFGAARDFIADGLLDSYDMFSLVVAIDEACGISIEGVDILPEHFQNLDTIAALLRGYGVQS